jgi:hypothetical protein
MVCLALIPGGGYQNNQIFYPFRRFLFFITDINNTGLNIIISATYPIFLTYGMLFSQTNPGGILNDKIYKK